ncbi:unnamed protein product [Chrysoparadoxa australica]
MSDEPIWAQSPPSSSTRSSTRPQTAEAEEGAQKKPKQKRRRKRSEPEESHATSIAGSSSSRVLCFFFLLTSLTVLTAVAVAATNVAIIVMKIRDGHELADLRGILLRGYGVLFSIFILGAELEWRIVQRYFGFLKNWVTRGVAYAFVGLVTWDASVAGTSQSAWDVCQTIVSFMMIGIGALYAVLGLMCMRTVKEAESGINERLTSPSTVEDTSPLP